MKCLCYQVVLKECLSHIVLSTGFLPLTPHHVFITDKFGTLHHLPVTADDNGHLTLNLSLLPAGHFMSFSGSYQLQVYTGAITEPACTPVPDGEALELTICGNTYNCITLSFEANPAHLTTQTIPDCDALQPVTADELFCVNEYTGNFCPSVKACLGITPDGTGIKFLNDRGEFVEVQPGATTLGALSNVLSATDTTADGDYIWHVTAGQFALQPFTVDLSGYYTTTQVDEQLSNLTTSVTGQITTLTTQVNEQLTTLTTSVNEQLTTVTTVVDAHLTDYNNPHQTTLEQARLADNYFNGDVDMNNNRLQNLPAATTDTEPATFGQLKQYIDTTIKALEGYNPSSGLYPVTYSGSAIKKGDSFKITATGTVNSIPVKPGDFLIALTNAPAQLNANWQIGQSNVDQATETEQGIAMLATQAEVQNEFTAQNTNIVTPQKLWFGLLRFVQLGWTWAAKQIFTTAPRFSSAAASQYLKTDASKDLTSVATIPATDITEDSTHRFVTDTEKAAWNNSNSVGSKLYLFHNY